MTAKSKQIAFKNPFDLIEDEEEEPMSMPTNNSSNRYQPTAQNVHTPLPFNPYQIKKQEPVFKQERQNEVKSQAPKLVPPKPDANRFVSPFEQPKQQSQNNQHYDFNNSSRQQLPKDVILDQNGDPPLLQDIGIEPEKIKERIMLVLKVAQPNYQIIHDPDLSGPVFIALALGCLLLFAGKIHFGDIYAMFILGNLLLYCLLNFMSQVQTIPLYNIMSTLGYGLLPMLGLGFVGVFFSLNGGVGIVVALMTAVWSSFAAGNFMDVLIKDTKDRKLLIVYPLFLFYVSFTLIVIF